MPPDNLSTRVATPQDAAAIAALRRLRFTGAQIAELLAMAETTVSGILTRIGMGRLGRLGLEPPRRYERARPGELVHVDVKKLGRIPDGGGHRAHGRAKAARGRGIGYDDVHSAVDDRSRVAFSQILPDEAGQTCARFLVEAAGFFAEYGVRIERVLTVLGFVASAPRFAQQPAVVDGASQLLHEVFGDAGRHSRSAVGVAALPRGGAVEIEVEVAVREG